MNTNRLAVLFIALMALVGCSEATKQEAKEALDATGEAVQAAADDAKSNAEKVGEAVKAGVERGREEFSKPDAPKGEQDATSQDALVDHANP